MRAMKDSGVEWIGEIPIEWSICRLKNYATILNGQDYNDVVAENGSYPVIGSGGQFATATSFLYDKESVLLGRKGTINKPLYINRPFWTVDTMYYTSIMDSVMGKYFYYLCTQIEFNYYQYGSAVPSMTQRDLNNVVFPLPNINIQRNIAAFLDSKCAQIDAIIEKQQQVIEKLKAYKQSVITEAVTKGLDPTVPMKDSGVEWIGKVPCNWNIIRLKFVLDKIIDCPHETPNYSQDGTHYVIRTADQDVGQLKDEAFMYRLDEDEYQQRVRRESLNKNDIVYGREGERWGLACLVPASNQYCLGQRMMQFRCTAAIAYPTYIMWLLNSKHIYMQGSLDTYGSTSPHVNISTIRNYAFALPTLSEQILIAEYLNARAGAIDTTIGNKERLISYLESYKKSLIYETITGKMEV